MSKEYLTATRGFRSAAILLAGTVATVLSALPQHHGVEQYRALAKVKKDLEEADRVSLEIEDVLLGHTANTEETQNGAGGPIETLFHEISQLRETLASRGSDDAQLIASLTKEVGELRKEVADLKKSFKAKGAAEPKAPPAEPDVHPATAEGVAPVIDQPKTLV